MPNVEANLLIVEDDVQLRVLLSETFASLGYKVRSTQDGFSALRELRSEIPDIILSDLDMPGMSGFELLSVVRRRFPAVGVVAMSGRIAGDLVPHGVAADAFYEKGTSLDSLLQLVGAMAPHCAVTSLQHPTSLTPIWIPMIACDLSGATSVVISCPECLRTFPQLLTEAVCPIHSTTCVHCNTVIHYAIVDPADPASP